MIAASGAKPRNRRPVDPAVALLKFQQSGDTAAPLTTAEAALVLGICPKSVVFAVWQKRLKSIGHGYFLPDDLRAFIRGKNADEK